MGHARVLLDFRVRTAHTDRYEKASKSVLMNVGISGWSLEGGGERKEKEKIKSKKDKEVKVEEVRFEREFR